MLARSSIALVLLTAACAPGADAAYAGDVCPLHHTPLAGAAAEHTSKNSVKFFPSLDELESNRLLNRDNRKFTASERATLEQIIAEGTAEMKSIAEDRGREQQRIAEEHILADKAEPYVPGETNLEDAGYAAIVIASVQNRPPAVVRLLSSDLPDLQSWQEINRAVHERTWSKIEQVVWNGNQTARNSRAPQQPAHD